MRLRRQMAGLTISSCGVFKCQFLPIRRIVTGTTVACVMFFIRSIFVVTGEAIRISGMIHLSWQPLLKIQVAIGALIPIIIFVLVIGVAGLAGLVAFTFRLPGIQG